MLKSCLLFIGSLLLSFNLAAERSEPMMAWAFLVQIDFAKYHGKMMEQCDKHHPESAAAFRFAIEQWSKKNTPAILILRSKVQARFMQLKGLSEPEAAKQILRLSRAYTEFMLQSIAVTSGSENEWKDACKGKYVDEALVAMDFEEFLPHVLPSISTMREDDILPPVPTR